MLPCPEGAQLGGRGENFGHFVPRATRSHNGSAARRPRWGYCALELLTRTLVSYLGILAVFSLGNSSDAFLLLRARNLGLTTAQIPVLWSVLNLSKVVWAYLGGDAVVYALVYLGLGRATQAWHVWALFVLYGVFYGLTEPVEKALVRDLAPADQRGRAYGAYNFVVGVTALPAGLLMGVLWRVWGAAHALEVGAALAAVSGVALLLWDAYRRPR